MKNTQPHQIKTISQYHTFMGLEKAKHDLISVINFEAVKHSSAGKAIHLVPDFYAIGLKSGIDATMKYGQQYYEFDQGLLFFLSPGQVIKTAVDEYKTPTPPRWLLIIHPDFLWNKPLARRIKQFDYFRYSANKGLYLSKKEEAVITGILHNIEQEYCSNDKFSQDVIIAQLEQLMVYADRFYQRQFMTRKNQDHYILSHLENILIEYFNSDTLANKGLPTVGYIAETLNVSPDYLSESLKALTGRSAQQHIHDKLLERAKEKLSATDLSVSEIAYQLGFEHSQSFSRLFKRKTGLSPLKFRYSFN